MSDFIKIEIFPDKTFSLMNLDFSEHDNIEFKEQDMVILAQLLSSNLGINDLLKLRDHVEEKIKEIYNVQIQKV